MLRTALIVATLAAVSTSPAHAQLGGLMRKAKDKAAEMAQGPAKRTPAPTYDNRVLEITDARVDQLLKGLAAEQSTANASSGKGRAEWKQREDAAFAERKKAYEAQTASYQKDMAAWNTKVAPINKCRDAVDKKYASNPRDARKQKEYDACGEPPIGPAKPDIPEPTPAASEPGDPTEDGARGAGFTGEQYSVMKERVAYLLSIDADFKNAKTQSGYGFSDAEAAAVKKRLDELKKYKPLF